MIHIYDQKTVGYFFPIGYEFLNRYGLFFYKISKILQLTTNALEGDTEPSRAELERTIASLLLKESEFSTALEKFGLPLSKISLIDL